MDTNTNITPENLDAPLDIPNQATTNVSQKHTTRISLKKVLIFAFLLLLALVSISVFITLNTRKNLSEKEEVTPISSIKPVPQPATQPQPQPSPETIQKVDKLKQIIESGKFTFEHDESLYIKTETESIRIMDSLEPEINDVRMGVNNKEIHFSFKQTDPAYRPVRDDIPDCISLEKLYTYMLEHYSNPVSLYSSGDLECHNNGFSENSNYYIYAIKTTDKNNVSTIKVYLENNEKNLKQEVISTTIDYYFLGFNRGKLDFDNSKLIYPTYNATLKDSKILVSFTDPVIVIDLKNNYKVHTFNRCQEDTSPTSKEFCFHQVPWMNSFHPIANSYLVPVTMGFEGPSSLVGILDLSAPDPAYINVREDSYKLYNNGYMNLNMFYFDKSDLVVINPKYDNYDFKSEEIQNILANKEYDWSQESREVIQKYIAGKKINYIKLFCYFDSAYGGQGASNGCYGLKRIDEVRTKEGSTISELSF